MDTIGTFDDQPYKLLDVDLASGGTVRSLAVKDARSRSGCSVQLTITGSSPANLVLRVLGKNTVPASDTERLLPLSLVVPDLSALVADYAGVFLLPMYTAYMQLEVQSISGAAVHVRADVLGTNAAFDDAGPAATSTVQLTGALPAGTNLLGKVDVAVYTPWIDTVASADTAAHAYGTSQVVKAPVFIRASRGMVGTVTISDGVRAGMVLNAGDPMSFHGTNLNQLNYQFSTNAATEKFHLSTGI